MSTFYYLPQIPDSVNVSRQDTVRSQGIDQEYEPAAVEYASPDLLLEGALQELRQQVAAIPVIPKLETGTPVRSATPVVDSKGWNSNRNFFTENGLTGIVAQSRPVNGVELATVRAGSLKPENITPQSRFMYTHDWFLGIFLLVAIFFVWIRIFYSKFFATLANALVSFQGSAKLFRERNVLVHRVSIVLDAVYILVMSLFLFEFAVHFKIAKAEISAFNLFLIFLNAIIFYSLLRRVILKITGFLFLNQPVFSEYLHNTFVINKGLGIALFPVVIMAQYFPYPLTSSILILGMIIYLAAFLYKSFRGYQIIIRKDILLFYLILYLCTLEILPLLLGYKFVTSLI
ncbi:MAG: DUF4271 domain-containing protein [Bacteroidales bacterium]|nr:DUF4271 domain-containing protein [Bacteroidales bacterium]